METLNHILKKYNIKHDDGTRMPIEIPGIGRDNLSELFHELGFKVGVEIGVEQGIFSESLIKNNPGSKLYSIDPWKAYRGYRDHTNQDKINRFYEEAKARLAPYNVELVRKFSLDAVNDFADNSLDFVYIDGNHNFYNATADIWMWSKKLKIGGIMAGHDYVRHKKPTGMHVVEVVNAYTDAYDIRPWFILGEKAMYEGVIRDESRSFMWVNDHIRSPRRNQQ